MIRVAINGFGRIGRVAFRALFARYRDEARVVAVNTSGAMETAGWGQLLARDSTYGAFPKSVHWDESDLIIDEERIAVLSQRDPAKIPWGRYGVDVVIESTGVFRQAEDLAKHLDSGAKRVVLSAPAKGSGVPTFIQGVNLESYKQQKMISCGSCTTNCVAPLCAVLLANFKIEKGEMTTVHALTSDQRILDGSHRDLRRARTAFTNIVPTTSGAAEAVIEVLPKLKSKFTASALRVPVVCGSFSDLTFLFKEKVTVKKVNQALAKAAEGDLAGIIHYSEAPLVSSDIIGRSESTIVDSLLTKVIDGNLVKIGAWYDNEWAYSCRLVEEVIYVGRHAT